MKILINQRKACLNYQQTSVDTSKGKIHLDLLLVLSKSCHVHFNKGNESKGIVLHIASTFDTVWPEGLLERKNRT